MYVGKDLVKYYTQLLTSDHEQLNLKNPDCWKGWFVLLDLYLVPCLLNVLKGRVLLVVASFITLNFWLWMFLVFWHRGSLVCRRAGSIAQCTVLRVRWLVLWRTVLETLHVSD